MQFNAVLRQIGTMMIVTAAAWLWQVYGRVMANEAVLATFAVFIAVIALALWRRAKSRREVWLNAYFQKQSPISHWLRGGAWMLILQGLTAIVLGLYLAITLLRTQSLLTWVGLLVVSIILPIMSHMIARVSQAHIHSSYRQVFSTRIAALCLGVVLWCVLLVDHYYSVYPDFRTVNLDQAIWYMMTSEQARSGFLLTSLEIVAAADGLRLWLAQHLLPAPATELWQVIAWCLLLAQEALFVWSYLLMCVGALSLHHRFTAMRGQ